MTPLEKRMHERYTSNPRTGRRVDDAIKAAAQVAIEEIEKAIEYGVDLSRKAEWYHASEIRQYLEIRGITEKDKV